MPAIEVQASDVESAIAQGLKQLNLIRAEVKIEILDEGSRGVLGIGSRPARVRLTPFAELEQPSAESAVESASTVDAAPPSPLTGESALPESPPVTAVADEAKRAPKIEGEELAQAMVQELLERMGMRPSKVAARSVFPADSREAPYLWVEVTLSKAEEDLLLGHKREGLKALQAVVQIMWSHKTKSSTRVNIDVNGRRQRREQQLIKMARRLAEKVIASGRVITLEPMPADERRIVHLALRDYADVFTESIGEGESRKVQIKPRTERGASQT
jgi:spoIIIJ-associated protein